MIDGVWGIFLSNPCKAEQQEWRRGLFIVGGYLGAGSGYVASYQVELRG